MVLSKDISGAKGVLYGGSALFFLSIIVYTLTNQYLVLAVPFVAAVLGISILNLKSFYWFFLLTIPLSFTIYFLNGSLSTTVPDEPLAWLLLLITITLAVYNRKLFPGWFFREPITLVITLQLVWMIVAVVFSKELFPSLKFAAARFWFINAYFLFPVLIFRKARDFRKAFLVLVIPVTLHAIFAFCWHYKEHFNYWQSNIVVHPFYFNHVDYSTVLSMLFPLIFIAWRLCKGKPVLRWLLGLTLIFYIPAIYAAAARAAILAVFFAFFIGFMIHKRLVNWVMPIAYALILAGVLFLAQNNYYIKLQPNKKYTATQPTFMDAVTGMFTGRDMSSMERFYRWIAAVRMSNDNPVTGVGPNNFYDYYKPYTVSMFATWVSRNPERSTTHNYFLYMLVEQGYPAMILYGILIFLTFAQAQKTYHNTDDNFYRQAVLGTAMLLAAGFVNNFFSELIETHKVGALFYLGIAALVIMKHLSQEKKFQMTSEAPGK
ncbi:MAG TPA: O-antigen ligase family protein [Edaphocola sp.]|nr:O-antigen ligase family protein [Edaphocola sp.]